MSGVFHYQPPGYPSPPGACDTHVHVLGPYQSYPLAAQRTYTPLQASITDLQEMLNTLGLERVVLVQPSIYGTDNRCLRDALTQLGVSARGVAVLEPDCSGAEWHDLQQAGVCGVRLNTLARAQRDSTAIQNELTSLSRLMKEHTEGWHVQIYADAELLPVLESWVINAPVPVVLDHFGGLPIIGFEHHPGWNALRRMLDSGNAWLKLSGFYRLPGGSLDGRTAQILVKTLLKAYPERVLWGSDWPHTPAHSRTRVTDDVIASFQAVDAGAWLDCLIDWAGSTTVVQKVLVDNPARLYGFESE